MDKSPYTQFNFRVEWSGAEFRFQEVTGLNVTIDVNEHREGGPNLVLQIIKKILRKIPGLRKYSNITLKRGVFCGSPATFAIWRQALERQTRHKAAIRLSVRNEHQQLVTVWRLEKARPVKVVAPDLKSDANEVVIETLELTCEGVNVE